MEASGIVSHGLDLEEPERYLSGAHQWRHSWCVLSLL